MTKLQVSMGEPESFSVEM